MKKPILLLFLMSLSYGGALCQSQAPEIEYWASLQTAERNAEPIPRRIRTIEQYYRKGKLTGTETHLTEHDVPNRYRYVYSSQFGNEVENREIIKIGDVAYCREAKGRWKKASCDRFTALNLPSDITFQYAVRNVVQNGATVTEYRRFATYKHDEPAGEQLMEIEWKHFVSPEGRIIRRELNRGHVNSDEWRSSSVTTYEYRPNGLKIVAPIK